MAKLQGCSKTFRSGLTLARPHSPSVENEPPRVDESVSALLEFKREEALSDRTLPLQTSDRESGSVVILKPTNPQSACPTANRGGLLSVILQDATSPVNRLKADSRLYGSRTVCPAFMSIVAEPDYEESLKDAELKVIASALQDACLSRSLNPRCKWGCKDGSNSPAFETYKIERSLFDFATNETHRAFEVRAMRECIEHIQRRHCGGLMLFIIFPGHSAALFSELTRICEAALGIRVVFLSTSNIKKALTHGQFTFPKLPYSRLLSQALHRMELRFCFLNRTINLKARDILEGTMIVGMQTYDAFETATLTAVVASCDMSFAHYLASIRVQARLDHEVQVSKERTIQDLKDMFLERFNIYELFMGCLPKHVLVFRVGSTRCLLDHQICDAEIKQIRTALQQRAQDYIPRLTYVACGSDHNEEPYQQGFDAKETNRPDQEADRRRIIGIESFDFYLSSLASHNLQNYATLRTRYTLILDEGSFALVDLQHIIASLCSLWERTECEAYLVAPARAAKAAVYHAKSFVYRLKLVLDPTEMERVFQELREESKQGFAHQALKNSMYYM